MNILSRKNHEVTFFLPIVEDDFYSPRGRIQHREGMEFETNQIVFKQDEMAPDFFSHKLADALISYDPEYIFLGGRRTFKTNLGERLKSYKQIWRSYNYDLICPRMSHVNHKGEICTSSFLSNPHICRDCIKNDPLIDWNHPLFKEMELADIFSEKYYNLLLQNIKNAYRIIMYNDILETKVKLSFPDLKNIRKIPTGISLDSFSPIKKIKKNGTITLFFPGRVEDPAKGFEFLIDVFKRLIERYPHIELLITGKYDPNIPGIRSAGWVSHKKMPALYQEVDICIIPSLWEEPFGIVALESLAMGIPVIASNVGGLKTIINQGKNGFLIDPGNTDQFIEHISTLIVNHNLRLEMGRRGRERAFEFSWDNVMEEYQDVFS